MINTYPAPGLTPIQYVFYVSPHAGERFSTFYSQTYVPNHFTDGLLGRIGSGNYANYVADYNTRRVVSAPMTVTVQDDTLGTNTAYVKVRVTLEAALPSGHKVYIGLWEDNVVVGGSYGTTPVRVLERDLYSANVTVSGNGQWQEFEHTFNLTSGWKLADLGITAWVQGPSSDAEAHNGTSQKFDTTGVAPSSLGRVKALFN